LYENWPESKEPAPEDCRDGMSPVVVVEVKEEETNL
jgi:hypothetical protein